MVKLFFSAENASFKNLDSQFDNTAPPTQTNPLPQNNIKRIPPKEPDIPKF